MRRRKGRNMCSHVLADWYHIIITVLKLFQRAEYCHRERLGHRKLGDCRKKYGFEDGAEKQDDGTTKMAWYTKSRALACLRTRELRKTGGLPERFRPWGEWRVPFRRKGLHKIQLLVHVLGWVGPITDHSHEGFLG